MTEEELSKMISEFLPYPAEGQHYALKQFAKLVAAAERAACVKIVMEDVDDYDDEAYNALRERAFAILERGKS